MKAFNFSLQASLQTSYANNGKTTLIGRVTQKMLEGAGVLGPTMNGFVDVETVAGFAPQAVYYNPVTGNKFVCMLPTTGAAVTVAQWTFNNATGAYAYAGKIILNLPNAAATTHSLRGFAVNDSNSSAVQVILATTGTVAINGGIFICYTSIPSFTNGGTEYYAASGAGQNAIYFLQGSDYYGVNHNFTTSWGCDQPFMAQTSAYQTKIYMANNTIAAPQFGCWDTSIATPTVAGMITNGVSAQTTAYGSTSPSAYFTMGSSQNGYSLTNGDQVVLMNGTGNVPSGFTAWSAGTLQVAASNVYFVRDLQLVSGNYYFNLSTTTGGAAVVPTSSTSDFTMMRAFGICTNLFYGRTPITGYTPSLAGTIVQNNVVGYARPISAPANSDLNGKDCLSLCSSTNVALFLISDLFNTVSGTSSGSTITTSNTTGVATGAAVVGPGIAPGTTVSSFVANTSIALSTPVTTAQASAVTFVLGSANLPSLTAVNALGDGVDIVAPTITAARYGAQGYAYDVDAFAILGSTSTWVLKQLMNSSIKGVFGATNPSYMEGQSPVFVYFGVTTVGSFEFRSGWCFAVGASTVVGQRGVIFTDISADQSLGLSGLISPVIELPPGATLRVANFLNVLIPVSNQTQKMQLWIRASSTNGSTFSSGTLPTPASAGNWTAITNGYDYQNTISLNTYVQIAITWGVIAAAGAVVSVPPAQVYDAVIVADLGGESVSDWQIDIDSTTVGTDTPSYVAFYCVNVPDTLPTTLYIKGYNSAGSVVLQDNTGANLSAFSYSTNGGTSWSPVTSISEVFAVGNKLRYNVASPPGQETLTSLRYLP